MQKIEVVNDFSIHAPREGSDGQLGMFGSQAKFSIHAPREGSDQP